MAILLLCLTDPLALRFEYKDDVIFTQQFPLTCRESNYELYTSWQQIRSVWLNLSYRNCLARLYNHSAHWFTTSDWQLYCLSELQPGRSITPWLSCLSGMCVCVRGAQRCTLNSTGRRSAPQHAVAARTYGTPSISARYKYLERSNVNWYSGRPTDQSQRRESDRKHCREVVRAVILNIHVFWDVTPCPLVNS